MKLFSRLGGGLFACAMLACRVYDESLLVPPADTTRDAQADGASDADGMTDAQVGAPLCPDGTPRRIPPSRPAPTAAPDRAGAILFGLKDPSLEQNDERWREIGFDLDGICTGPDHPEAECAPPTGSAPHDGVGGIDNTYHRLFELLQNVRGNLAHEAVLSAERGVGAVLITLSNWNGTPNDSRVHVTVAQSVLGTPGQAQDTVPPEVEIRGFRPYLVGETTPLPYPSWDGNDWFWARSDSYVSGDPTRPLVLDDNAYVAGGFLVATLPARTEITFADMVTGVKVRLTDSRLVGELSDGALTNVMVGGRWALNDLFQTAASVGICESGELYELIRNAITRNLDVRSAPGSGGPGVECDAMSLGIRFQGVRIRIAGVTEGQPVPMGCQRAGQ